MDDFFSFFFWGGKKISKGIEVNKKDEDLKFEYFDVIMDLVHS